jgi:exodeoxyribonuclease V alpha subunit
MTETHKIQGTVERVVYYNQENGFTVFVVQLAKNNSVTVKGYTKAIVPGEYVSLNGSWINHQKFGKQFDAKTCESHAPQSIEGLKKYLGSGLIKGIGPVYGEKLVNHFGENVLTIIDITPDRLYEVPGIGQKRIEKIKEAWKDQKEISTIMVFLQNKGISSSYAIKIYKCYKQESIAIIEENPYRLAQDIWGIGFKTADTIAQHNGIAADSPKRIAAAIVHTIQTATQDGHLYVEIENLKKTTAALLDLELVAIASTMTSALHDLYNKDAIKLLSFEDSHYITTPTLYFSEKSIAATIQKLLQYPAQQNYSTQEIISFLRNDTNQKITLNEAQEQGVTACLKNKVTIITGGPGTGKTTLIKKLLDMCDAQKITYQLAAPTGRAAKRMSESTHKPASTIHRLLQFDVSTMRFSRNETNALPVDMLIVDEASMIDIFLANALLKAVRLTTRVVIIGDKDQLRSVGPGNFLHDCIESEKIPVVRLSHIFRQAQNSMITLNAHRINEGQMPTMTHEGAKKDFIIIKEDDPALVQLHLQSIFQKALPRYNIKPEDTMILSPMHRGIVGTQELNTTMQKMINTQEGTRPLPFGSVEYRHNDRVMQLKNNYDKNVFNGDIGFINDINHADQLLTIQFPEQLVTYEFNELNEITHAYAISIHKSQGSEFDAIIIPFFMQHFMMLQKNLFYTGVTRAKKLCILIGEYRAIAMAVKNSKCVQRITFLQKFLTTDLACR